MVKTISAVLSVSILVTAPTNSRGSQSPTSACLLIAPKVLLGTRFDPADYSGVRLVSPRSSRRILTGLLFKEAFSFPLLVDQVFQSVLVDQELDSLYRPLILPTQPRGLLLQATLEPWLRAKRTPFTLKETTSSPLLRYATTGPLHPQISDVCHRPLCSHRPRSSVITHMSKRMVVRPSPLWREKSTPPKLEDRGSLSPIK